MELSDGWRKVAVKDKDEDAAGDYCSNVVTTAHFPYWNYFPISIIGFIGFSLLRQFRRAANDYFLVICILQMIPSFTITNGVPTLAPPFVFVLGITVLKEAFEDLGRASADKEENSRLVEVWQPSTKTFVETAWRNVAVGDLVKVKNRQLIPADMLLVASSDTKNNSVFINTKNLDGESDLKIREVHKDMPSLRNEIALGKAVEQGNLKGDVVAEPLSKDLLKFEAHSSGGWDKGVR